MNEQKIYSYVSIADIKKALDERDWPVLTGWELIGTKKIAKSFGSLLMIFDGSEFSFELDGFRVDVENLSAACNVAYNWEKETMLNILHAALTDSECTILSRKAHSLVAQFSYGLFDVIIERTDRSYKATMCVLQPE